MKDFFMVPARVKVVVFFHCSVKDKRSKSGIISRHLWLPFTRLPFSS